MKCFVYLLVTYDFINWIDLDGDSVFQYVPSSAIIKIYFFYIKGCWTYLLFVKIYQEYLKWKSNGFTL